MTALSISKYEENAVNEDAAIAREHVIAVSDGAGGGGVYAEYWANYLVEHLPEKPLLNYAAFNGWIDGIWEPFYNDCEEKAKAVGGMFLDKFYDEGSYATLVAVWKSGDWISYGDSVAFCYNFDTGILNHSFTRLADFTLPPYLVNCKDPLQETGFRQGRFLIGDNSIVFAASDALAHYILMMYEVSQKEYHGEELEEAVKTHSKNSNFIKTALSLPIIDFECDVLCKLLHCNRSFLFKSHVKSLIKQGLIGHDDYSISIMGSTNKMSYHKLTQQ